MRKKSAFLERLTARAAAAFEAGGSFVASDEVPTSAIEIREPAYSMATSTSADVSGVQKGAAPVAKSTVDYTQLGTELGTELNTQLSTEQGTQLDTENMALGQSVAKDIAPPDFSLEQKGQGVSPVADEGTNSFADKDGELGAALLDQTPAGSSVSDHGPFDVESALQVQCVAEPRDIIDLCVEEHDDVAVVSPNVCSDVGLGTQLSTELNAEQGTQLDTQEYTSTDSKQHAKRNSAVNVDGEEERVCASLGTVAKILFAHLIIIDKNIINIKRLELYNNKVVIPYASLRTAWARLKALHIISHSARHDIGKEKGVLFQLDGVYTFAFQRLYPQMLTTVPEGTEQSTELHTQLGTRLSTEQGTQRGTELTHQTGQSTAPKSRLEAHPEYGFWREHGLKQVQCAHWLEEFALDELLLDNYLRWCAYDVGQKGRKDKSGKIISNPANWFYSIMKKTGSYPKPEGYVSHEEKMMQTRELLLKEQSDLQARQRELRQQEEKQEAEDLFVAFLEEGESSPHFLELSQKVSPFIFGQRHTRRRLFENALRIEYFKSLGLTK